MIAGLVYSQNKAELPVTWSAARAQLAQIWDSRSPSYRLGCATLSSIRNRSQGGETQALRPVSCARVKQVVTRFGSDGAALHGTHYETLMRVVLRKRLIMDGRAGKFPIG